MKKILIVCTTDSMIWNFLIPHIKHYEKKGYIVECACSNTGDFYKKLQNMHIKMNMIPFERSPYRVSNLGAYKKLVNLIKEKEFDTIFCHEPVGGAVARLAGKKCNCSVVYMAHGFHFYKGAPWLNKLIYYNVERLLARLTDVLITINEEDYQAALKFNSKKVYKVAGIGVDTRKFVNIPNNYLRETYELDEEDVILLSVGELIPRKNHEIVIRALGKSSEKKYHYFIAGEGQLDNYLKELVERLDLIKQVHFLGYREDINRLCNSSDIFIMPSIQEGLSVAVMEAMGCGKPIIASRIRGNVDLIDDEIGGYLVSAHSDVEILNSIVKLNNSETRKKFGLHNLAKISDYDIEVVKKEIAAILIPEKESI